MNGEFNGQNLQSPRQKMSQFNEPIEFITIPLKVIEVIQNNNEQYVSLEISEDIKIKLQQMDDYSKQQLIDNYREWFMNKIQLTWEYLDEHFILAVQYREEIGYYWRLRTNIELKIRNYSNYRVRWYGIKYLSEGRCCNYFEIIENIRYDIEDIQNDIIDRFNMLEHIEDEMERMFKDDIIEDENVKINKKKRIKRRRRLKRKMGEREYLIIKK